MLHDIKREVPSLLMNGSFASKMIYRDLMVTMAAKDNNFVFNHINIITLTYFSFGTKHVYIPNAKVASHSNKNIRTCKLDDEHHCWQEKVLSNFKEQCHLALI